MKELSFVYGYSKILIGFNKTYNISESDLSYEPLRLPESFSVVFIILHVLLTCLAIGGNILLIYIITTLPRRYKKGETSYNASAAASDILMNCICVPFTALSEMIFYWWPFGTVMCPCLQFLQMTCVVQKSFNMVALNYDQHYAVAKPMKTSSRSKLIRSLVALSWIFAAFVSIPTAIRSRVVNLEFLPEGEGHCLEVWNYRYQRQMYSIAIILFQYLVPVTLVTILSLHSGYLIWTNTIPGEKDHRRDKMITKSKKRGVKMLVILVLTFALTWLPLHMMMIVEDMDPAFFKTINRNMLWIAFHWLALSNTGTNCIIYFWRNRVFQIRLKQIISNVTCGKFQINEQERSFSFHQRPNKRCGSERRSFIAM